MTWPTPRTDRWRWLIVVGCLLGLLGLLGLGSRLSHRVLTLPHGIRACLADPIGHDGTRVVFPVWFVAGVDGPDRYRVSRVIKDVVVVGDSTGLARGQEITLVGHFRGRDSVVIEDHHHVHTLRPYKKGLSLVGLLLAVFLAPRVLRWRDGSFHLRDRGLGDA
ncbi:MAG: hypothetical protein GXP62_09695 [Oligoflexia bacterium]|nr:hypothetical protein [Oligoflexia bacterium]